ncbi:hypothetical protein D8Y37_26970, partial [Escherichia coli]
MLLTSQVLYQLTLDHYSAILEKGFKIDIITDQTSAHDPLNGYVPQGYSVE